MVKRTLTQTAYPPGLGASFAPPVGDRARPSPLIASHGAVLDTLPSTPSTALLSTQEAKDRLREIVEGFFFRRLRTEDRTRIGPRLVQSPPSLEETRAGGSSSFLGGQRGMTGPP
jgi:hypothetical protein